MIKETNEQRLARERREDLQFMRNTSEWPHWPVLPLKRRDGNRDGKDAFVLLVADGAPQVYYTNLFALADKQPKPQTWKDALEGVEVETFADFPALADKYMVD